MPRALIALGANLGDCRNTFAKALAALAQHRELREIARSAWREFSPVGGPTGQPAYLNGAWLVETSLAPNALWKALGETETHFGRRRDRRWDARTLDLDLLLYDDRIIHDESLSVPHPRLTLRRFVLEPAAEIAGEMPHPCIGRTLGEIARHVYTTLPRAAIVGDSSETGAKLVERIAGQHDVIANQEPRDFARSASRRPGQWVVTQDGRYEELLDARISFGPMPPRLLVVVRDAADPTEPKHWPDSVRSQIGPVLFVSPHDIDAAVREILLAMQGLGDDDRGALQH